MRAEAHMRHKEKSTMADQTENDSTINNIVFDSKMRKTLVEGVIQDLKGYFDSRTNGLVEVTYDDYDLSGHEFGFKLHAVKSAECKKQMFSETVSAIVNAINYMFQGDSEDYDIAVFTEDGALEVEIVSNW